MVPGKVVRSKYPQDTIMGKYPKSRLLVNKQQIERVDRDG